MIFVKGACIALIIFVIGTVADKSLKARSRFNESIDSLNNKYSSCFHMWKIADVRKVTNYNGFDEDAYAVYDLMCKECGKARKAYKGELRVLEREGLLEKRERE